MSALTEEQLATIERRMLPGRVSGQRLMPGTVEITALIAAARELQRLRCGLDVYRDAYGWLVNLLDGTSSDCPHEAERDGYRKVLADMESERTSAAKLAALRADLEDILSGPSFDFLGLSVPARVRLALEKHA